MSEKGTLHEQLATGSYERYFNHLYHYLGEVDRAIWRAEDVIRELEKHPWWRKIAEAQSLSQAKIIRTEFEWYRECLEDLEERDYSEATWKELIELIGHIERALEYYLTKAYGLGK